MFKKSFFIVLAVLFIFIAAFALAIPASVDAANVWGNQEGAISNTIGLGERDPRLIVSSMVNAFMGFVGMIAVVIVLLGGFRWMTAGGNEEKLKDAKGLLMSGVIGLIIVMSSWGLAKFVVDTIYRATT